MTFPQCIASNEIFCTGDHVSPSDETHYNYWLSEVTPSCILDAFCHIHMTTSKIYNTALGAMHYGKYTIASLDTCHPH